MPVVMNHEEQIAALPERIMEILRDYRHGHAQILPPRAFSDLKILEGGVGAGTVLTFKTTLGGVTRLNHVVVTEPLPGRRLVETDAAQGIETAFDVTPVKSTGGETHSIVRITTTMADKKGVSGWAERTFAPNMLRKVYAEELGRLRELATR